MTSGHVASRERSDELHSLLCPIPWIWTSANNLGSESILTFAIQIVHDRREISVLDSHRKPGRVPVESQLKGVNCTAGAARPKPWKHRGAEPWQE